MLGILGNDTIGFHILTKKKTFYNKKNYFEYVLLLYLLEQKYYKLL